METLGDGAGGGAVCGDGTREAGLIGKVATGFHVTSTLSHSPSLTLATSTSKVSGKVTINYPTFRQTLLRSSNTVKSTQ
jgi:hypothetical protein